MTVMVLILFKSDSHHLLDFDRGQPITLLTVGPLQVIQGRGEECDGLELMEILASVNNPQK